MCRKLEADPGQHLTPLEPQSRFGDKPVKFQVVCPQNGTAVLKGLTTVGWDLYTYERDLQVDR